MNGFLALTLFLVMTAQQRWAYIVMGESSGEWPQGSSLVAWTLRAWQVEKGMPSNLAGPRWGWYAWRRPNLEAIEAVNEAWNKPLTDSPFRFMQGGYYCDHLGSGSDVRYWKYIGLLGDPDYTIHLSDTDYSMNCYFVPMDKTVVD